MIHSKNQLIVRALLPLGSPGDHPGGAYARLSEWSGMIEAALGLAMTETSTTDDRIVIWTFGKARMMTAVHFDELLPFSLTGFVYTE